MCFHQELQSGVVDLLIHTPNSFADVGSNTDRCTFCHLFTVTNQNSTSITEYQILKNNLYLWH